MVRATARRGMAVILDMHDYFKYGSHGVPMCEPGCRTIGSPGAPVSAYAAIWRTLAHRYARYPNVQWSLNTEPFDVDNTVLVPAYQAAIDAIRGVTRRGSVIVDPGEWASVEDFQAAEPGLLALHDPAGHLLFDEHAYFDDDHGGDYRRTYRSYAASWAGRGPAFDRIHAPPLRQLEPFLEWLRRNRRRGIVGEIGVPANERRDGARDSRARWIAVLSRAYADLARRREIAAVVYWAGGLWECRPNENELPASDGSSGGVCRHGRAPQLRVLDRYRWPGLAT
ncbi:MAG: glycoside hydrolase family 5 protein, partial [Actinomycetota bacterium]|nr:glycoside hydrolase family 5 protein [Actinomycetota bacterium]